jgi:hypothetical protein
VIPKEAPDSAIDIYKDLKPGWDYKSSCEDITAGTTECVVTAGDSGIEVSQEVIYLIPKESSANLAEQSSADDIADVILKFNLEPPKNSNEEPTSIPIDIKAATPERAKKAWDQFAETNKQTQYLDTIDAFIEAIKKGPNSKNPYIEMHPYTGEITNIGEKSSIVTDFDGKKLTVGDLLHGTAPKSEPEHKPKHVKKERPHA